MWGFVDPMQPSSKMLSAVGHAVFITGILCVFVQQFTCSHENFCGETRLNVQYLSFFHVCTLISGIPCAYMCMYVYVYVCVVVWLKKKEGTRLWRERVIIPISLFPVLSKSAHHRSEKVHFIREGMGRSEGWVRGGGRQGWKDDPNKKEQSGWPECTQLELCDTWHTRPRDKTITANAWTHQSRTDHYYGLIHQHN